MADPEPVPPQFPQYDPPKGIPVASHQQAKPMLKMMRSLFKPHKLHSTRLKSWRKKVKFY